MQLYLTQETNYLINGFSFMLIIETQITLFIQFKEEYEIHTLTQPFTMH